MRILIIAVGSRGDVQPYVALGQGLQGAGHTVTLATSERFATLATGGGLRLAPLRADFLQLAEGQAGTQGGKRALLRRAMVLLREMLDDLWQVAQGAEALIYHPKALGGPDLAERLAIRGILAHPVPLFTPTRAFPSPILPVANLGGWLNYRSHMLMLTLITAPYRRMLNRWRHETLGLPPAKRDSLRAAGAIPRLYGFSTQIVPRPADWDASSIITGSWVHDAESDWAPPAELSAFLARGPAPVYVGFGSMSGGDSTARAQAVVAGLRQAGMRGIIATGEGGVALRDVPEDVYLLQIAPHDWLFRQVAAVVHHGGAGTTAAGLRAGRPTVIVPFMAEQAFWGRRVAALGVGPQPLPQRRLSATLLTDALGQALEPAVQARAAALGERLRAEEGVGQAVAALEALLST